MTAPATTEQYTSLAALVEVFEAAQAATRVAAAASNRAQLAHDEEVERFRDQRAERQRALDEGASVAHLAAADAAIADAERHLEVTGAALRQPARTLSAAKKSEQEAERQLATAERRARGLPQVIRDIRSYLVTRQSELFDAERVAKAIRAGVAEYEGTQARLERELRELTE